MKSFYSLINVVENIVFRGRNISREDIGVENFNSLKEIKISLSKTGIIGNTNKSKYNKLLNSLYEKVLTIIPSRHKYTLKQRRHIKLVKLNAVAKLLVGLQAKLASIVAYDEVYKTAIKINNSDLIFESSKNLFPSYATTVGNMKKAKFYYEECNLHLKKIEYEIKADWYHANIMNSYKKSKKAMKNTHNITNEYINDLEKIDLKYRTVRFSHILVILKLVKYESIFDYNKIVAELKQSLAFFYEFHPNDINQIRAYNFQLCTYLTRIENYKEAEVHIEKTIKSTIVQSGRWLRVGSEKLFFLLRVKRFQDACIYAEKLIKSKAFKSAWREFELYILVMHKYAIVCLAYTNNDLGILKNMKLARFMNSIPEHDADKQARNIPTIILQILYFIAKRDYDMLESKFDAINKYLNRYVKSDDLFRSFSFIKMLMQVHRRNFHPVAIDRHTQKYQKNLASIPYIKSREPIEIEFVKYEDLWELVMTFLKNDTRKSRLRSNKS